MVGVAGRGEALQIAREPDAAHFRGNIGYRDGLEQPHARIVADALRGARICCVSHGKNSWIILSGINPACHENQPAESVDANSLLANSALC